MKTYSVAVGTMVKAGRCRGIRYQVVETGLTLRAAEEKTLALRKAGSPLATVDWQHPEVKKGETYTCWAN